MLVAWPAVSEEDRQRLVAAGEVLRKDPEFEAKFQAAMWDAQKFRVGDRVIKDRGDYTFEGIVVAAFRKIDKVKLDSPREELQLPTGPWRYVAQNREGILHIYSDAQLRLV